MFLESGDDLFERFETFACVCGDHFGENHEDISGIFFEGTGAHQLNFLFVLWIWGVASVAVDDDFRRRFWLEGFAAEELVEDATGHHDVDAFIGHILDAFGLSLKAIELGVFCGEDDVALTRLELFAEEILEGSGFGEDLLEFDAEVKVRDANTVGFGDEDAAGFPASN